MNGIGPIAPARRSMLHLFLFLVLVIAPGCPDDETGQTNADTSDAGTGDEPDTTTGDIDDDSSTGDVADDGAGDSGVDDSGTSDGGDAAGEDTRIDLPEDGATDTTDATDAADLHDLADTTDATDAGDTTDTTDAVDTTDADTADVPNDATDAGDTDGADGPTDMGDEEVEIGPPPPSSVAASNGTSAEFVAVTWAAMADVTEFRVFRDGEKVGTVSGDGTFFWDRGADPSVPKVVAPVATQGHFADNVVVTWSSVTSDAGPNHSYTVRAVSGGGESADSIPDLGFRKASAVTHYQISLDSGPWEDVFDTTYEDTTAAAGTFQFDAIDAGKGTLLFGVLLEVTGHPVQGTSMDYDVRAVNTYMAGPAGTALGYRMPQPSIQWQRKVLDAFEDVPGATHAASWDPIGSVNGDSQIYHCKVDLGDGTFTISGEVTGHRDVARVVAADGQATDHFADTIAVSDEWAAIGVPLDDDGDHEDAGSVRIYHYDPVTGWSQFDQLTPPSGGDFGESVATWGDRVVVGAGGGGDDKVFIYRYSRRADTPAWELETDWVPGGISLNDSFGVDFDIFGNWIVAGVNEAETGEAYMLRLNGAGTWEDGGALDPTSEVSTGARFGHSVAIDGNRIIVGAPYDQTSAVMTGAAYVFRYRADAGWEEEARLLPSDRDTFPASWFGYDVDIDGGFAVVGAPRNGANGTDAGAAFVFRYDRDTDDWVEETRLLRTEGTINQFFGISVAMDWGQVVIGSPVDTASAAFLFRRGADFAWSPTELTGTVGEDSFGGTTALGAGWALVGASWSQEGDHAEQGSATFFWTGRPQRVADTGQTSCYYYHDGSGTWREDPSCTKDYIVGSPIMPYGQDAHYVGVPNPRHIDGPTADSLFTDDRTTADVVTGLVWKTCAEGQFEPNCSDSADRKTFDEWRLAAPCSALNDLHDGAGYAGRSDWRMPSARELSTLMPLDMDAFPGGSFRNLWSRTPSFDNPDGTAFFVRLDNYAGTLGAEAIASERALQCVTGPRYLTRPYDLSRDGAVVDTTASLLWQRCGYGRMDDPDCMDDIAEPDIVGRAIAYDYCENLVLAGRDDWRVPNAHEFVSLLSRLGRADDAVDRAAFPETVGDDVWFWLSTSTETDEALVADPVSGAVGPASGRTENAVRCVTNL